VLISGESGTGKELVARMLYLQSPRRRKVFMKIDCASLPCRLLESELFGYEKGAFTSAGQAKPGKFELANHGTLYLDEIAELHPSLQVKLLQVLQDGKFSRLGGKQDVQVDTRIIASTNRNLEEKVFRKEFREDLFFRLNVLTIKVPPLRERKEEIPFLVQMFCDKFSADFKKKPRPVYKKTIKAFQKYDWPGNIRELENMIKRIVLFGNEDMVRQELARRRILSGGPPDLPEACTPEEDIYSLKSISKKASMKAEKDAILDALERSKWNRRRAADALAISYKAFLYKMKQAGITS
jgi:two-component system response regulator AtoC